jgi:competence protein ComEA
VETLLRRALGNRTVRYAGVGTLVGVVALAALLLWRGREQPTLVLEVQPLTDPSQIRVYVGGAVVTPGLYSLARGSRVAEAIDAAGGTTADGDTSALGMAAPLEDADQVIVPSRPPTAVPTQPVPTQPVALGGGATPDPSGPSPTAVATRAPAATNINTASAAELEALPGIGPALAARIIEHRETNGPFQSVDELEQIRGISAAMVEELRPLVTIGQ